MNSYWFAPRPKNSEHQHPFLVFDCSDRLHVPLTVFGKEASVRVNQKTVQIYLYAILPFFTTSGRFASASIGTTLQHEYGKR